MPEDFTTYSAFTVAEMGQMLKDWRFPFWYPNDWVVPLNKLDANQQDATADTEADARANMLIYLIENGLLKFAA